MAQVPFRSLELRPEERQHCQDRAFQLLDRTLRAYDDRDGQGEGRVSAPRHHANLDNTHWKLYKTQDDASLYTERSSSKRRDLNLVGGDWVNPIVVLMVGTIRGDLDEVMLGVETPDFASIKVRSETNTKQPVTGAMLATLESSAKDPFRFLGIQWQVYDQSWPIKAMVRPRDFVNLASTGTMTRANGDRVGYEVVQPANLSQCPPLPEPFMRAKMMYAAIFKQQEPGVVDVYVHTYVEVQNFLLSKIVMAAIWRSTLGFWEAPKLAELKKLQWCIKNKSRRKQKESPSTSTSCTICFEKRAMPEPLGDSSLRVKDFCVLCASPTCSDCLVERTFKVPSEDKVKLDEERVSVCRDCMEFVQKRRAADIAGMSWA